MMIMFLHKIKSALMNNYLNMWTRYNHAQNLVITITIVSINDGDFFIHIGEG